MPSLIDCFSFPNVTVFCKPNTPRMLRHQIQSHVRLRDSRHTSSHSEGSGRHGLISSQLFQRKSKTAVTCLILVTCKKISITKLYIIHVQFATEV